MKYNKLGNTEISVSEICLGTMTFGEQNSEKEAHEQLDYALDNEVNFIDTAEMYAVPSTKENSGLTEKYIGNWIAKGNREKVVLATKVTGPAANLSYVSENLGYSKSRISEAIEKSLKNLRTDYVDLYQLHWPERSANFFGKRGFESIAKEDWKDNIQEVVHSLNNLIKEGKIRSWGLSNETPWGAMRYLSESDQSTLSRPATIQNPYNLLNRSYEVGMSEVSIRENIGLLAYSPMAFGLLSGKYHSGQAREDARMHKYKQLSRYNSENSYLATTKYIEIADKHDLSLVDLSLAFIRQQPFVTSVIIGATSMTQLKENIESANVDLGKEVLKDIEEVQNLIPNPAP